MVPIDAMTPLLFCCVTRSRHTYKHDRRYYGGPAGIGNPNIIGFYIDDDWGNMDANGPSEMNGNAMKDMGLGPADLAEIVTAYNWVANTVYESIVAKGKWAWDLFLNNDPNCINCGDCPQPWVKRETCKADLRAYGVNASSPMQSRALLYGFSPGSCHGAYLRAWPIIAQPGCGLRT